jgi:hypothetical protein
MVLKEVCFNLFAKIAKKIGFQTKRMKKGDLQG